uniref:Uncharacterized protein n=1 Tax=Tetradesmus obliquus TaxID=3088 RepID=A0A383WKJ2_TETOB|eukprot:jgi/Sobl393_1/8397/SZX77977.1
MAASQEAAAQLMLGEDPQQTGDALLERYKAPPFQKAISSGRYAKFMVFLRAIYNFIQSSDGPSGSQVPTVEPGWRWFRLRPPVPTAKAQLTAAEPTAPAPAAPAAAAAAAASDGAGSDGGVGRTRSGPSSDGIVRSFPGYTSATPIALGGGRYLLCLRMRLTGRLAGWALRLWVCAFDPQQPAEQPGQQQQQQGQQQGLSAGDEQTQHLGARLSGLHVAPSSEDLDVLSGPMPLPGDLPPAPASPDTLASLGLDSIEAGMLLGLAMPAAAAAAAAAAAGSSPQSPFNATHGSPHPVFFSAKSVGSKGSAEQHARKQARDGKLLLVDTGVGWCVLEPNPVKAEAAAGGSGTATAELGCQSKRSRPSSAEPANLTPGSTGAAAATAAAPAAAAVAMGETAAGEEEVAAEVTVAAAADACARPAAAMQGNMLPAARQASMQSTMGALSQRLQQLQLSPHKVMSLFHPPSNAAAATAAAQGWEQTMSDPTRAAKLRQLLLRQDVRDTKARNVLHLTAAGRRPAGLQQLQLDFLLQPDLLVKLQGQVNNNGSTPLLLAATWGQPGVYGRLLAAATADVLYTFTQSGWSPLHRLAQSAAAATNAADRGRFLRCIRDTVDRLGAVQLQEAAAAAAAQHQPLQQAVAAARECVVEYVSAAPAPSRHYTGQAVLSGMNVVQMAMERFDAAAATVLAAAAAAGGL